MKLSELPRRTLATVGLVEDQSPNDPIARRLRELGFVDGEQVEVVAAGPFGAEPLLVQVGFTRFALRRSEAARIVVAVAVAAESTGSCASASARPSTAATTVEPA
ncbi:iron transporter FeoA [Lysobacter psychrotolerans]|uniref:Iron transporter FeoA n=1 Tax=Montanilutibacter psychrotolerans TaxID=1327343 RepID=A0A3M8T741_9GAMM|nr:iron transporter FeoA [Lysobacter psychrotolerans]